MKKPWLWILWIAFVLASVAWQPFRLGFYSDDWNAVVASAWQDEPFTWTRYAWVNQVDPHRPSLGPIRWVFSSLLGESTLGWHMVLLAASILVAWLLGRAACALTGSPERAPMYGIAAAWLVIPWAIAFRIWPLFLAIQLMLACFTYALYLVFTGWREGKPRIVVPALLYLVACLGYEAFHFQFVPVVLIGLLLVWRGRASLRDVLASGAGLVAADGLSLGWIFLAGVLNAWSRKSIQPGWLPLLGGNIRALVPELLRSMSGARVGFIVCVAALGVLAVIVLWMHSEVWMAMAACAAGAAISLVIFAMGLRPVMAVGVETRALSLLSFWMIMAACILGDFLRRNSVGALRVALSVAALGLGICLAGANCLRAQAWSRAWTEQQKILNEAPVSEMLQAEAGATVLYVYPREVDDAAPIFATAWDINTALPIRYPGVERLRFIVYSKWTGPVVWDGKDLKYIELGESESAPALYIWRPGERSFYRATQPLRVNTDLSIEPAQRRSKMSMPLELGKSTG